MEKGVPLSQKGKVVLSCGCTRVFVKPWPQVLDEIWCAKHNDRATVSVTEDIAGNYGWLCDCGRGRRYGAEKAHMEARALEHHNKHPSRTVYLHNGKEIIGKYEPEESLL